MVVGPRWKIHLSFAEVGFNFGKRMTSREKLALLRMYATLKNTRGRPRGSHLRKVFSPIAPMLTPYPSPRFSSEF